MSNPFHELQNAFQLSICKIPIRDGKYTCSEIQKLHQHLEYLKPNDKKSFIQLLRALRTALPYFEKWEIDFITLKPHLDALARQLNLPVIDWEQYLSNAQVSPRFHFHERHKETPLIPWLASKSGESVSANNSVVLVRLLLEYREHPGFSQKLSAQLEKEPDFLVQLIMESEEHFIHIAQTRLILYLTDEHLVKGIIKYISRLVQDNPDPRDQANKLVEKLNTILSNGRSVSTLLRNTEARTLLLGNTEAKTILENSELFQIYQDNEPTNPPSSGKKVG